MKNKRRVKQVRNYLFKTFYGKKVERYESTYLSRFLQRIRLIKWEKPHICVYLRVSYGTKKDVHGKMITFYNDAKVYNKKDFKILLDAFLE